MPIKVLFNPFRFYMHNCACVSGHSKLEGLIQIIFKIYYKHLEALLIGLVLQVSKISEKRFSEMS